MVAIPPKAAADPTLEAANAALEAAQPPWRPRGYLGMSILGDPCERKLWYSFRWATESRMPASGIKAINDGYHGEDVQAERLRAVDGIELHTENANTKAQFSLSTVAGHVRGHMDGAILGLLQAPKTWHVWEHKQVNETKQRKLESLKGERGEKAALAEWDVTYHAQAILYMAHSGMTRHYLTVASPGGRRTISVRTNEDKAEAARLEAKATRIVAAPEPLSRVSEKSEYYWCKWCEHADVCHGTRLPLPTCRTCVHSTPEMNGDARWSCALHGKDLSAAEQLAGCTGHLYLPVLVTFATQVDADSSANTVTYELANGQRINNGAPGPMTFSSGELHALSQQPDAMAAVINDETVQEIRARFDGRIGTPEKVAA